MARRAPRPTDRQPAARGRVLLLLPPLAPWRTGFAPRHPPHYALFAAALFRDAGWDPVVLDAFFRDLSVEQTVEQSLAADADLALVLPFDYTRETHPSVTERVARELCRRRPDLVVGLAGTVDEPLLRSLMDAVPGVRFAAVGEYEAVVREIAHKGTSCLDDVPGLLVRRGGRVVSTGRAEPVMDLDALPFPGWDLVDLPAYAFVAHRYRRLPVYPLLASRGCPYACASCMEGKSARATRFRLRSVADVLREMKHAVDRFGAREIQFCDPTFGQRREWVLELCEAMAGAGLDLTWSAVTRVDLADPEMLAAMAHAGCWNVLYGVESANPHALEIIGKRIVPGQAVDAIRWTQAAGLEATASFILGLPGESREDILRTIGFAVELAPDYAQFFLFKHCGEEGRFDRYGRVEPEWDFSAHDIRGPIFVPKGLAGPAELKRLQRQAYRRFYLRPGYLLRRLPRLLSLAQLRRHVAGFKALMRTGF